MNRYKNIMEQVEPSTELIQKTKSAMNKNKAKTRFARRTVNIMAAVLATLLIMTISVYGKDIANAVQQIMFGHSTANQVPAGSIQFHAYTVDGKEIDRDNIHGGLMIEFVNRSDFAQDRGANDPAFPAEFSTFEKARLNAPFALKEPHDLPQGALPDGAVLNIYKDGTYSYNAYVRYKVNKGQDGSGAIILSQYYVGSEAYVNITTEDPIQKVMVGDIEGAAITTLITTEYAKSCDLQVLWIKNGILYNLQVSNLSVMGMMTGDKPNIELILNIAESVY